MTTEHQLRVALSGFKCPREREAVKLLLRRYPSLVRAVVAARLRGLKFHERRNQ